MKRIITILSIVACSLWAGNEFFSTSKDGYFYYKDEKLKKHVETNIIEEKPEMPKVISTTDYNSTFTKMNVPFEDKEQREYRRAREKEYIDNIPWHDLDNLSADEYRRLLDTTREIAVATPNKNYVKSYAALQKFWVDKSERFAQVWGVANLEDPDELAYGGKLETSTGGRKIRDKQKTEERKRFFAKLKDHLGFIVIVEDIANEEEVQRFKNMYDTVKEDTGLDYVIVDYYEVPQLARKLKIDQKSLPDHFMLYRGDDDKEIYKRVIKGYVSSSQIIDNAYFVFQNAIREEEKLEEHRTKE